MVTTTERMSEHWERLARLEGESEHLATKADVAKLEAALTWRFILISLAVQALGIGVLKYLS